MKISTDLTPASAAASRDPRSAPTTSSRGDFQRLFKDIALQRANAPASYAPPPPTTATTPPPPPEAAQFVTVRDGDTLVSIAQRMLQSQGLDASPQAAMRAALQLARDNRLANANLILPGQTLSLNRPAHPEAARGAAGEAISVPARFLAATHARDKQISTIKAQATPSRNPATAHPLLEKTLARAVSLQYISETEKPAVRSKVLELAAEHHFVPDDLAIVTLIESDGMNPKASNGRCHGVIQFCDGLNRGAASVGYKNNPRAIMELSVLDQLDLVGKYFSETGLKNFGKGKPASLDDLYLTILTPAARRERSLNTHLDIAGQQATILHGSSEPNAPITRTTLLQGLLQNAREKLSMDVSGTRLRNATPLSKVSGVVPVNNNTQL